MASAATPARVGTGQSHTAPEVRVSRPGKPGDRLRDARNLGPLDEPEAPAQPLVEDAVERIPKASRGPAGARPSRASGSNPDGTHSRRSPASRARGRTAPRPDRLADEAGPAPTGSHVDHVGMRFARAREELAQSVASPGSEQVEQVEPHSRSFEGEAAQVRLDSVQFRSQPIRPVLLQGGMIAVEEGPADLLETLANAFVPAAKTSPGGRCLLGRDPEEAPAEPAQYRSHIVTGMSQYRCTNRHIGWYLTEFLHLDGLADPARTTVRRAAAPIGGRPARSARPSEA